MNTPPRRFRFIDMHLGPWWWLVGFWYGKRYGQPHATIHLFREHDKGPHLGGFGWEYVPDERGAYAEEESTAVHPHWEVSPDPSIEEWARPGRDV